MIFKSKKPIIPFPDLSIYEILFESNTKSVADRPCYIDVEDPNQAITYSEVKTLVLKFGAGLKYTVPDSLRGDVIAIYSPNHIYYPAIVLGAVAAGWIIASIDHSSDPETAASCLEIVKAKIIIAHPDTLCKAKQAARIAGISTKNIFVLTKHKSDDQNEIQSVHDTFWAHSELGNPIKMTKEELSTTPSYFYFTSGTTGRKKAVPMTQKAIAHVLFIRIPPVSYHLRVSAHTEFHHCSSLLNTMHLNIWRGYTTYVFKNFVLDKYFCAIQHHKINFIQIPPWLAAMIVKDESFVNRYDLSSLIIVTNTGTAPDKAIMKAFHQKFKVPIINFFGMTETMGCFVTDLEKTLEGSVGVLEAGYTAKLIDENGKELGHNVTGELCVKGPTVMSGYYNNPEANFSVFDADGFFHTGDLFQINENGAFTHIDRISDVIKYRYQKIVPQEIETVVISHPLVICCAAVGCLSEVENEYLITAFVTLKKSSRDLEEVKREILELTKTELSDLKQIRGGLYVLDNFPRNSTGKVDRRALRQYNVDTPIR